MGSLMRVVLTVGFLLAIGAAALADVASGPKEGEKAAALPVYAVTGDPKEKDVDYITTRKDKPTVYVFVNQEKWGRPMFQFIKKLDELLPDVTEEAAPVAVWLTDKPDDAKAYLPKISQYFNGTSLTVFTGDKAGPKDWGINLDAHVTAVLVNKGKVVASFGYQSVNGTDAEGVRDSLKKALKK
jgi:hypothetical protein